MKIILFSNHGLYNKTRKLRVFLLILIVLLIFGDNAKSVFAQASPSMLYVPLIGITSVPNPFSLPNGPGYVTYSYAVKNFLPEVALVNIHVVDDTCSPVKFANGDDNGDGKLDYSETWRYTCTTKLSKTTQSTATATATVNDITASHKAYTTVVVGANYLPPLVSIVNITKVAYPFSLPAQGGKITYTYKVNNPGIIPLKDVTVTDSKCSNMSGRLGDTNGNNLLDINEVWIYTCTTTLKQTTTNTATVIGYANGLKAVDNATITVRVANSPIAQAAPQFPSTGEKPVINSDIKIIVWEILSGILAILILLFMVIRIRKFKKTQKKYKTFKR